jgi:iron complex outermembrane receptor protein
VDAQVVAHTFEAGLCGTLTWAKDASLRYNLAFFHTNLNDDIVMVNSPTQGRAFFTNVVTMRRQVIDPFSAIPWAVTAH